MKFFLSFCCACAALALGHAKEVDVSQHRAIYAYINTIAPSLTSVTASFKEEDNTWNLKGWKSDGSMIKIIATDSHNGDVTEYYLSENGLAFVFMVTQVTDDDGKKAGKIEERFYFEEGKIIKWLSSDKNVPVYHAEDYASMEERLAANVKSYEGALAKGKAIAGTTQTTTGTFQGLEEGDYLHWQLKTKDGSMLSLFVLDADDAIDAVVKNPGKFKGKSCTVKWKSATEKIEEAGGEIELQKILSVKWN